MILKKNIYFYW